MSTADLYFVTAIDKFSYPSVSGPPSVIYNVNSAPLSSLPTYPIAWTGVGSHSFSAQGLSVDSGGYIQCSDLHGSDVLVDVSVEGPSSGINKVLDFVESDGSVVSVWIDFDTNEIWLDDVVGSVRTGFRPGISDTHLIFFRIGVRLIDGVFVARLYSAYLNSVELPLLQQTAGPSTSQDLINIGRLRIGNISGPGSYTINTLQIKIWSYPGEFGTTPDSYYPFPQVSSVSPTNGELIGGDRLRILTADDLEVNAGDELLFYTISSNDVSLGDASTALLNGELILSINSIGTAKRKFLNTYSGDRPSGTHLSFDLQADPAIVAEPPQTEVIVGAASYGVDGITYNIQMIVSRSLGIVFRIIQQDGNTVQFNQNVLATTQANHMFEFIRGSNIIILKINGTQVLKSYIPDGPGVVTMYSTSTTVVNLTSKFVNFRVRPVLLIGNEVATLI